MRRTVVVALLALTTATLGACSGKEAAPEASASATTVSTIPEPDQGQAAALLGKLATIDQSLNEDKSISRARDQCTSLLADARGEGGTGTLGDQVRSRFTADNLTDEQAQAIADAIMSGGWCVEQ